MNARRSAPIALLLLTCCNGCEKQKEGHELAIREIPVSAAISAFERLVPPKSRDRTFANCLEIEGHDPPREVLAALLETGRDVVPASECTYVIDEPGSFENATKRRAMFHGIKGFKRYGDVAAELQGASYVHGLLGSALLFDLTYRDGQWLVAQVRTIGVS